MTKKAKYRPTVRTAIAALLLLASATTSAQSASGNCEPIDSSITPEQGLIVGNVKIIANDIFNLELPGEQSTIHRLGNRLHKQTQPHVIKQQLLFKEGDDFNLSTLAESERLLRQNDYLKSASVIPVKKCGDQIDIEVRTRDHWSFIPKVSFTRNGGENRFGFEVTEANVLGLGKELAVAYQEGTTRDQTILEYKDRHVLGSRKQLTLQWQDNSDGERQLLDLKLPYYSYNSLQAWRVAIDQKRFITRLYQDREVQTLFDLNKRFVDVNIGRSDGLQHGSLNRLWLGVRLDETETIDISDDNAPETQPDRRFNYPYVAWQWQQPQFVKRSNLYMMEEVEDISLGHLFETRIGYASTSFDSTDDALILYGEYRKGWQFGDTLGLFNTKLDTIRLENEWVNTIARPQLEWFWFQSGNRTLYLSAKASLGDNLFPENQFLAGGDNGLRGYPLRMQSGNKQVLLSAEQRWYPSWYPWRLLRIGAAAFIDVGTAWDDNNAEDADWLGNAGIGLRLLSSRQANAPVTHIDLAVPFDQREDIDSVQLLVVSKAEF